VNAAEFRVSKAISPEEAVRAIADHLTLLEHDIRFRGRIGSLGVTVPGLVTSDGHVVNLPILGWKDVNLLNLLKAEVNLPAFVENNSNAAAFAAVYMEPMGATDAAIFLKIGTGCGGAAIVNGRLLGGSKGTAGEFGHMRIAASGITCDCGQAGCLETFVNLRALARAYHGTDALPDEAFAALPGLIAARWDDGEARARQAAGTLGQHLAAGIASLVNIFNPGLVMLGGAMRPVLARLLPDLQRDVAAAIVPGTAIPEIRLSVHGDLECAVGAAALAHHRAFDVSLAELT
jgi:predicted NBD/HSP70 family sugar kinase